MPLLAEVAPLANPAVDTALIALGLFALCIVAWGILHMLDKFTRMLFGTISGAVGWIPFADKVISYPIHQIERRISHALGSALHFVDSYIAWSWHTMARLVTHVGREIEGSALAVWHLAKQAEAFVRRRDMTHAIRASTLPLKAKEAKLGAQAAGEHARVKALRESVAQGVYPRLKAGEVYDRTVARPGIASARAEAKAAEDRAVAMFRWLTRHKLGVAAGVFTGAVAWALTRLGGGWIRCNNWRRIGRHICGLPLSLIEGLLSLALAFLVVMDARVIAQAALDIENAMDDTIRGLADPSPEVTRATQLAVDVLKAFI